MTEEQKERIKAHLFSAMSNLYQDNIAPAMDNVREALKLLDGIDPHKGVGIVIRADLGDTIERITECTHACNGLIMATKKLDKTFNEE
jgi:succinate dehydrogenase/fumarate reductase flavoprotein subunit